MAVQSGSARPDLDAIRKALTAAGVASRPAGPSDAIDGVQPIVVATPADETAVAAALRAASSLGARVAPRGGGTRMRVGQKPTCIDLILEVTAVAGVVEHEPADLTATVQAGIRLADLQRELGRHGQFVPIDPPLPGSATIGGTLASNASGPLCQRYGTARDLLIGVRVAGASGVVTHAGGKVVKNVAGYDLCKLHVGSLGTLGVITEASLKLAPLPETRQTVIARSRSVEDALALARVLARTGVRPLAMDVLSASAADRCGLSPERGAAAVTAIQLGGHPAIVRREFEDVTAAAGRLAVEALQDDKKQDELWGQVRDLPVDSLTERSLVLRGSVPLAALPAAWAAVAGALPDSDTALWARAGIGTLYATGRAAENQSAVAEAIGQARAQVQALGGSLTVERCPLALKAQLDVWGLGDATARIMIAIKRRLDPDGVLNPGRFGAL